MKIRSIVLAAVALAIICGFAFTLSPPGKQSGYLWHQHRVSHQVLAANTVIFTEDPGRIAALRQRTDYREKRRYAGYPANSPEALERKSRVGSLEAFWEKRTGDLEHCQVEDTFGCLRTSSGGIKWIVHLDQVNPFPASDDRRKVLLTQASFQPAGWKSGDRAICVSFMSEEVLLKPSDTFTLFAPQPDADDASRVNVPYELNGQSGVLNGIVTDRGYVQFSVRSGPAQMVKWDSL